MGRFWMREASTPCPLEASGGGSSWSNKKDRRRKAGAPVRFVGDDMARRNTINLEHDAAIFRHDNKYKVARQPEAPQGPLFIVNVSEGVF